MPSAIPFQWQSPVNVNQLQIAPGPLRPLGPFMRGRQQCASVSHDVMTHLICLRRSHRDIIGPDPQVGTASDTYTHQQYWDAMRKLMLTPTLTAQREG
jgi:hypothetical protein